MNNFLALLGWSPGGDREVMMMDEMVELFSAEGLLKKASVFDPKKLEWMNGQHLALLPLDDVARRVAPALVAAGLTTAEHLQAHQGWYYKLLELLRIRARTIDDIVRQAGPYFREHVEFEPDAVAKQWKDAAATRALLQRTADALRALPRWEPAAMEESLRALAESMGVAAGKIFQPLRVALTGLTVSPGIFDVLLMLGRELALKRIEQAVRTLGEKAA
jgi:glutamyl-tRNA synthetase